MDGMPDGAHIRMACQACQKKKIKCDRNFPCGQCTRAKVQCMASTRKQRARHVGKRGVDLELRARISKLESLVESLSGEVDDGDGGGNADSSDDGRSDGASDTGHAEDVTSAIDQASPTTGRYLGSSFWASLTSEVQALRDALEEDPDEDENTPSSPTNSNAPTNGQEYDLLICPPGAIYVMPGALAEPSQRLSATLCEIYCENVDRMFKCFHQPTLKAFMIHGAPYLGHEASALCNKALKATIWFGAVITMTDEECRLIVGQSRSDAGSHFRRLADVALAQADLYNTNELATLQAFLSYLATVRSTDPNRRMWTLMPVAVRIARAMGLDQDVVPYTPFVTELRRRTWHRVRFLDAFSSLDRASPLLIAEDTFDTPLPSNVNDAEFDEQSSSIPSYEKVITEMSLAHLAYDATAQTNYFMVPESKPNGASWQQRLEIAKKFQADMNAKYLCLCDCSNPYQAMLYAIGNSMTHGMLLRAVRPMQKHVSSKPPRVDSPFVLQLATDSLRASEAIHRDPRTAKWRWMTWVQWHALAVALGGLCSIRDTELAKEAWELVDRAYHRNARHVAEGSQGMLWRPIEKLYNKASLFRDHGVRTMVDIVPQAVSFPSQVGPATWDSIDARSLNAPTSESASAGIQLPEGGFSTGDLINSPMNLLDTNYGNTGIPMVNADISWMDFERIMEDMSNPIDNSLAGMQWPQDLPSEQNWNAALDMTMM